MDKTLVIFDGFGENNHTYGIANGDYRHLNYKYINSTETTDAECDDINALASMICADNGVEEWYTHKLPQFPSEEALKAIRDGAYVIITGCIP